MVCWHCRRGLLFDKIMAIGIQELSCEISWICMEIRYDTFDSLNLTSTIIVKICHISQNTLTCLLDCDYTTIEAFLSRCSITIFDIHIVPN